MEKISYHCDYCKFEIEKPYPKRLSISNLRTGRVCIDLCEDCYKKLFAEHLEAWAEEDKQRAERIAERKLREQGDDK